MSRWKTLAAPFERAVSHGESNASVLAEHTVNSGHEVDWDNATVLNHSDSFYPRLYLESWYMYTNKITQAVM